MGFLATAADERVADVTVDHDMLSVRLKDGRTISDPLGWYPRLFHATSDQRNDWQIAGGGYAFTGPALTRTSAPRDCFAARPLRMHK